MHFAQYIISVLLCIIESVYCVGFRPHFIDTTCCAILVAIGLTTPSCQYFELRHCFAKESGIIIQSPWIRFLVNVSLEQVPRESFASRQCTNTSHCLLLSSQNKILHLWEASLLLTYWGDEAYSCFFHEFTQSVFAVARSIYFMHALTPSKQTVKHEED